MKKEIKQLRAIKKKLTNMRLAAEDWKSDYEILFATILSARTRDETTIPIAEKLFKKYPSAKKLASAKKSEVEKIIRPINFHKNKTKNIINCAKKVVSEHNGKIPRNFEKLLELPGVGRKTANVFLSEVGDDAIGVDTHISYISQKLKWTKNKSPHKIEEDLKKLFPKRHWSSLNPILVKFGKTYTSRNQKNKILTEINQID